MTTHPKHYCKRIGTSCAAALLLVVASVVAPPVDAGMGGMGSPGKPEKSWADTIGDAISKGWDFFTGDYQTQPTEADRKRNKARDRLWDRNNPNAGVSYGPALNGRD